jgi:hypothetical protein
MIYMDPDLAKSFVSDLIRIPNIALKDYSPGLTQVKGGGADDDSQRVVILGFPPKRSIYLWNLSPPNTWNFNIYVCIDVGIFTFYY